jgi:N-methylhydantoinase B
VINPDTPQAEEMDCMETRMLPAGTVVRLEQAGGAGYGDPLERSRELVRKDIEDGYLSPEAAAAQYKYKPEA